MSSRIATRQLITLSRSLGTSLHAGIDVVRAFEIAAKKSRSPLTAVLQDIVDQLQRGETVAQAFQSHGDYFPPLFCNMVEVAEQTGSLPEVFLALSEHYENNLKLRNEFLGQIALPVIQLAAAIFIIAGVIWIMGWVASVTGQANDILGLGLIGTTGALTWLSGWCLAAVALFVAYRLAAASLSGKKLVHQALLRIPAVGHCLQAFAVARFSWGFHLTQEAGLPIEESLEASLQATSNGAFIAAAPQIIDAVNAGETLTDALERTQLFPLEFIELVHVAETSGTVPEQLHRLSPRLEMEARRALKAMTVVLGWAIWSIVAAFIVIAIFRIFFWYWSMLDQAGRGL